MIELKDRESAKKKRTISEVEFGIKPREVEEFETPPESQESDEVKDKE